MAIWLGQPVLELSHPHNESIGFGNDGKEHRDGKEQRDGKEYRDGKEQPDGKEHRMRLVDWSHAAWKPLLLTPVIKILAYGRIVKSFRLPRYFETLGLVQNDLFVIDRWQSMLDSSTAQLIGLAGWCGYLWRWWWDPSLFFQEMYVNQWTSPGFLIFI